MRSIFVRLGRGCPPRSTFIAALAGLLLAGCSSSIDRFTDYPGESDKTHTASVPSRGSAPGGDEIIESSPIAGSNGSRNQAQAAIARPDTSPAAATRRAPSETTSGEARSSSRKGKPCIRSPVPTGDRCGQSAPPTASGRPTTSRAGQRILIPGAGRSPAKVELAKAPACRQFLAVGKGSLRQVG